MKPEMRDVALRLREAFKAQGAPDISVGVGSSEKDGERVPTLYVYATYTDTYRIQRFDEFEGHPVRWSVGAPFVAGPATDAHPGFQAPRANETRTSEDSYILLIDTNTYTGNFEREITAYCTGQIGDCEVGDSEREIFEAECEPGTSGLFEAIIQHRPDDDDCRRPCAIWEPPQHRSVAIFFSERPSTDLIDLIQARARAFAQGATVRGPRFAIMGFRLIYEEVVTRRVEEAL